jgi:hypothetical protein
MGVTDEGNIIPIEGGRTNDGIWVKHTFGRPWWQAPLPKKWHRCKAWSIIIMPDASVERCACGGIRIDHRMWVERNQRRHPMVIRSDRTVH